ncbi:SDR family NAD(P)-dependent oxidoreductase [Kordiimonas pumila]|uniref:SDR family NAD(P)-dependent oxidoreductase n=1 Tax=Kordiimonas pumila TaxID=2161677 RepID=A0ABV7D2Q5_9PROT|nr:SDR family oxidoreductase [Kordiimonas pumila]
MDLNLVGKRVLVTGGTRGIGAAIVKTFLMEGADVAFCARNSEQVDAVTATLQVEGYTVYGAVCDVSDTQSYIHWIEEAVAKLGGVDIFVPNVSGGAHAGDEGWNSAFQIDLMGVVKGCETILPHLASKGGSIVVITSIAGLEATGGVSAYNTVKTGLITYASQLGEMVARHNVRVNCVSPGPVYVEDGFWGQIEKNQSDTFKAVCAAHPLDRMATTQEVANAVVFLASPLASWVTRTNLIVDGGFTRRVQF